MKEREKMGEMDLRESLILSLLCFEGGGEGRNILGKFRKNLGKFDGFVEAQSI